MNKIFKKNNIKFLFLIFIFMMVWRFAEATDILLEPTDISVEKGEIFVLEIKVNPKNTNFYTTKIEIKYPAEMLEVKSFDYYDKWISLEEPGYDLVDNDKGYLIKTAGYPGGVSETTSFGKIFFKMKKEGASFIKVGSNTFVLNKEGENIFDSKSLKTLVISGEGVEVGEHRRAEDILPKQLFDISFELSEDVVSDILDLVPRTTFFSFGTAPTPVGLLFTIVDDIGNTVYSSENYIIVETEAVLTKKIEDVSLSPGKYTMRLKTTYNVDVDDDFEKDFEIIFKENKGFFFNSIWFWVLIAVVIIIMIVVNRKNKIDDRLLYDSFETKKDK